MIGFDEFLTSELKATEDAGLLRSLRAVGPSQGTHLTHRDRTYLNFSSNDYLGLAGHPAIIEAARSATLVEGAGSGASRLVCGSLPAHRQLEADLARFKRTEAALTFSSGYAAALGTIPALVDRKDVIILDKLCHACLVDGARLSGATLRVFPHNDISSLESRLRWARENHPDAKILILAESVYSMDGDTAPLREIVRLKSEFGAWLMLDEAHGVGVFGSCGRGLADAEGVANQIEVQMGTLGKALGSSGAYICGKSPLREFLINRARSFIFSTAPTPASAAAASASVTMLESPTTGEPLLTKLRNNIDHLAEALNMPSSGSPILPVILGEEDRAMTVSKALLNQGFLVPAIRYPTVARGAARLRITVSAAHTPEDIIALSAAVRELLPAGIPATA